MQTKTRFQKLVQPLSILLAVLFLGAGAAKLAYVPMMAEKFATWGYPEPLMLLVGAIEVLGALLLVIPRIASVGAVTLGAIMIGAIYTHLFRGVPVLAIVPALVLAALAFVGNRRLDSPFASSKRQPPLSWTREQPEGPRS